MIGDCYGTILSSCAATGSIKGQEYVGGMVGYGYSSSKGTFSSIIESSYYTGTVMGASYVGGLVGYDYYGTIQSCYATGVVTGSYGAGGLLGYNTCSKITSSYATSTVDISAAEGAGIAGGLVGIHSGGIIEFCYATGKVSGSGKVGGLVGTKPGNYADTIQFSFYNKETTGCGETGVGEDSVTGETGVTGLTSVMMRKESSFTGFSFATGIGKWRIMENYTYPILQWQSLTADERISLDQPLLALTYGGSDNANSVTCNLTLPTSGANSTTISWSSSNPLIVANNGVVTRPTGADEVVTLTATVSYTGGISQNHVFIINVIKRPATINSTLPATLTEALANDGSLTLGVVITLSDGNFVEDISKSDITASNLPTGMDFTADRIDATHLSIAITGKATSHTNANDVSNLIFTISMAKINNAENHLVTENIRIDFNNPPIIGSSDNNVGTDADRSLVQIEGSTARGWDGITSELSKKNSGSLAIDMKNNTIISGKFLEAIHGKDITVTLKLANGIEWVMNGTDFNKLEQGGIQEDLPRKDLDLRVMFGQDNIPAELLQSLPADHTLMQMSLNHNGEFGFRARLRLPLTSIRSGKFANLYYYNPVTNLLELQSSMQVTKEGYAEFDFTHASDYVILIDEGDILHKLVDTIKITPSKKILYIGGTQGKTVSIKAECSKLMESCIGEGGLEVVLSYSSSNPKVATVSSTGKVIAKSVGKTIITTTITINGVSKSLKTSITVKKAYIKLTKKKTKLKTGDEYLFQAVGHGVNAKKITWKTTAKSILLIDETTGKATAKSVGVDYVVAKVGRVRLKVKVTVY